MGLQRGNNVPNCALFGATKAISELPQLYFEHTCKCLHDYEPKFSQLHLVGLCRNNPSKTERNNFKIMSKALTK